MNSVHQGMLFEVPCGKALLPIKHKTPIKTLRMQEDVLTNFLFLPKVSK